MIIIIKLSEYSSVVADRIPLPNGPTKAVCCLSPLNKVSTQIIIIITIFIITIITPLNKVSSQIIITLKKVFSQIITI